jgi:predicted amidohydrolase
LNKLCFLAAIAILLPAVPGTAQKASARTVRVAVCQILVIDSDREGNFRRIEHALDQAEAEHADIAVFPESSILGWENPEAHLLAATIPGPDSNRVAELARKHKLMIAIGLDEGYGPELYDSAILVDKEGKLLWKHRKINVLAYLMNPPYSEGRPEDIGVVETEFGRIAVIICADTFTDAYIERIKALKPELMLVPYGWVAPNAQWPEHSKLLEDLVKRRASGLQCPVVGVDSVGEMTHGPWQGQTYGGSSVVADGTGKILLTARDRDTDVRVIDLAIAQRSQ